LIVAVQDQSVRGAADAKETGMLIIYGRANAISVRKVLWLADEITCPFERQDWGRGFRSTSDPEFMRLSTFGKVPVIDDSGLIVRESNTILRYLSTKMGRTDLYPHDLAGRTCVEAWMDWAITDLYNGARPVFLGLSMRSAGFQDPGVIETGISEWNRELRTLDRHLAMNGPYLCGEAFTIADIPVGMLVNRWFAIDFMKPHLPAVTAYFELLSQRSAFLKHGRNGLP
jgi:glutathione S-transferase